MEPLGVSGADAGAVPMRDMAYRMGRRAAHLRSIRIHGSTCVLDVLRVIPVACVCVACARG